MVDMERKFIVNGPYIETQNNTYIDKVWYNRMPSADVPSDVHAGTQQSQDAGCADNLPDEACLFRFIHPSVVDDAEKVRITKEIRNLVTHFPMSEICEYLMHLRDRKKIYLNVKPELALAELHRMGMPDVTVEGYSYKTFTKYYNVR